MERLIGYVLMTMLTLGGYAAQVAGDAKAADLLKQARAALGGDAALEKVQALSASGQVTRAAGSMQLAGDLTLQLQLPDRMLRTESLSPDGGVTLVSDQGINGETLLRASRTFNAPPGAVIRTPPPPAKGSDAEAQALRAARADLARLAVALLLRSPRTQPMDFTYAGEAESPDGKADVIDVKAREGGTFAAKLFLDIATHRPLMLSYRGVSPRIVMQTQRVERRPGAQPQERDALLPPPPPGDVVDIEMFLDDYRPVDGLMLPHHITRSVAGEVTEEWTFKTVTVNPTFKPGTFETR
jgi:hypothetical protein